MEPMPDSAQIECMIIEFKGTAQIESIYWNDKLVKLTSQINCP